MTGIHRVFAAATLFVLCAISAPYARAEVTELDWPDPPTDLEPDNPRNQAPICDPTIELSPDRLRVLLGVWFGAPNQCHPNRQIARPCNVSFASYHREDRALHIDVNATESFAYGSAIVLETSALETSALKTSSLEDICA